MAFVCRIILSLIIAVLLAVPGFGGARTVAPLAHPPIGERRFSISLNDERVGFGHLRIAQTTGGYEISGEGSAKMLVLGFSREASARERYLVGNDLSLKSFTVEQTIDGSPMRLTGEVTPKGIRVSVESAGSRKERILKVKGTVYPPPVLNIFPLMQGVTAGKVYRLQMLDVEAVKVKTVKITAVGLEPLADTGETIHLQNDLYTFVDNDIWVDLEGNTVRESVRNGMIVTQAEDEQSAKRFILEAAVAKKDLILDFSLVRVDRPIDKPQELKEMEIELSGFPTNVPLLDGAGQRADRLENGKVLFHLGTTPLSAMRKKEVMPVGVPGEAKHLEATERIMPDHPLIVAKKTEILEGEQDPVKVVEKLTTWVAAYVKDAVTDSQSPLETLSTKSGNCQSHARLYVSLARAAGIPTKFVSGLVYAEGKGFLYHSWAESYVGEWIAVDPTFNQVPADATHIKLVEGDSTEEMTPLAGIIGRVKARVVELKYCPPNP